MGGKTTSSTGQANDGGTSLRGQLCCARGRHTTMC
jgi:hypothetical protein